MNPSRHPPGLLARTLCRAALALPLILGAAAAHATSIADVGASSGGSWGGAGNNTWTPTAAGSVVSAAEVQGKLVAASHVKVLTHTADPSLAVKAALTLTATSHLELSSHRDIAIQAPVQAAGASVTMRYGQGSVAAGNTADIAASAPVHLSASSTYTTQLGSNGGDISHTIITTLGAQGSLTGTDLQGMHGNLARHYVLGADVDASATSGWNTGAGFDPVGNGSFFTGSLDGLGHTIEGLTINRPGSVYVGLVSVTNGARLRNIGLVNANITGSSYVGALAGVVKGSTVSSSYATGAVSSSVSFVGGLVGFCSDDCTITSSYATGGVSASDFYAGGLVGVCTDSCTISSSYATGSVSAVNGGLGGLVGVKTAAGTISKSFYATTDAGGSTINNGGVIGNPWEGNVYGTPKTLAQLKSLATFTDESWDIDDAGGTGTPWRIYDGHTTPLLRSFFTAPLTVTADSGSRPFDGSAVALGVTYNPASPDARLLGAAATTAAGSTGGTHAVAVSGVYSEQRGYDIARVAGTLTITAIAPDAPTALVATPGNAQATVSWTAPASVGGSAVTSYKATAVENTAKSCTVNTGSPVTTQCTVAGLTNGSGYTFTVVATNGVGPGSASAPSTSVIPLAPVVVAPPAEDPGPSATPIDSAGTTTITNPSLPVVVGPGASGGTLVLPGTGTTPVTLQVTINGQPLTVQALPGTQLRIAQVDGQNVLVLVVLQGWASMTSTSVGQPMVLAGPVLLRSGHAVTRVEAIPLAVAVQVGSLLPPQGPDTATRATGTGLPQVGRMGLQAGERLQVNDQGAVVSVTLGSLQGDASQPGDPMGFANLPASITVDKTFARLAGPLARLSGASMAQGLEAAPSGVFLVRDGGQIFQLLPVLPITIDATLADGISVTPMGLMRWVRSGVVVQFAPAVADLAGLASAVTTALPGATIKLGAEGVLQLRTGGQTYVLKPDWTGAGTATGTPRIGVDGQGRIVFQIGQGASQLLLPSLLNHTLANAIFQAAIPGSALAVQPASNDGAFTVTLAGQPWRLVPKWVLPEGNAAQVPVPAPTANWWLGADGLLYLKLGTQVQGVSVSD